MDSTGNRIFYISCAVGIAVFISYIAALSPTITSDDSGELSGVTATLGIAHSPGYPIYSLAGKIVQTIFPLGNRAYRANILSALASAAGAGAAVSFFFNISGSLVASLFCALALGSAPLVYNTATETEVYGISLFILMLVLSVITSQRITPTEKGCLAFYLMGLAFVSHYISALWLPAVIWKMWQTNRKEKRNTAGEWIRYTAFALVGLSPVIFIFLRAQGAPIYSWEDPQTLKRFWQVISRARYGGAGYLAQGEMNVWDFSLWADKIKFLFKTFEDNFSAAGLVAGLAGLALTFLAKNKNDNKRIPSIKSDDKLFLLLLLLGGGPGFLIMANVGASDEMSTALLSRFLYMASAVWCGYIAIALGKTRTKGHPLLLIAVIISGGFISAWAMWHSLSENSARRNHFTFYDYATNILKNTPPGGKRETILISDRADEMEFCVSYLLRISGKRPDIKFIDANAGVSKSIYGDDYYKIWGKPRLEIRSRVESKIIAEAAAEKNGPPVLYATFLPSQTSTPKTPYGLLHYSANFSPQAPFPDEVFAIRPPEDDIRSISIYKNHYFILGDYYSSISDEKRLMKNYSAIFYMTGHPPHNRSLTTTQENKRYRDISAAFAYHKAGFYFYEKGKPDEARRIYEEIIRFFPDDGDALLNLGVILEKKGEKEKARDYYLKAIDVLSKNNAEPSKKARAYYNAGALFWKENDYSSAADFFSEASRLAPENDAYRYYAGISRARINEKK